MFLLQTANKLLDLYNSLRELGHPQYIEPLMNKPLTKPPAKPSAKPTSELLGNPPVKPLTCAINRREADQRVCVFAVYTYVMHVSAHLRISCVKRRMVPWHIFSFSQVHKTEMILTTWKQSVAELRSQYDWLLFFSMPKLLRLYYLLRAKEPNLEAIVLEISFLCCNEQAALENIWKMVEVRGWKTGQGGRIRGLQYNKLLWAYVLSSCV